MKLNLETDSSRSYHIKEKSRIFLSDNNSRCVSSENNDILMKFERYMFILSKKSQPVIHFQARTSMNYINSVR